MAGKDFDISGISGTLKDEDQFYYDLEDEITDLTFDNYKKLELEADRQIFKSTTLEERPSFAKQVVGSLSRMGFRIGGAILKFPEATANLIANLPDLPTFLAGYPAISPEEIMEMSPSSESYKEIQIGYDEWVKKTLERHPEWDRNPPDKFLDLLTNPRELALSTIETAPIVASSIGLTLAGRPDLSTALIIATEGQDAKDRIIAGGGTEEQSNAGYWSYGTVAAAIEQYLHVKPAIKLGKATYQRVLTKGAVEVTKRGAKEGGKFLIPIIQETIEEPLQGGWQDWVTSNLMNTPVLEGGASAYVNRRGTESLVAFVAALIPGIGGATVGVAKRTTISHKLQKAGMQKGFADTLAEKITEGVPVEQAISETFEPSVAEGTYTGDIITEKKKIIDIVQTPITDQASLEEYGKTVAKHYGIEGWEDIKWVWNKRTTKTTMGKYESSTNTVTIFGPIHENDQAELKNTIIEELAHKEKPPEKTYLTEAEKEAWRGHGLSEEEIDKMWTRQRIHHKEFKQWVKNALEATKAVPVEVGKSIEGRVKENEYVIFEGTQKGNTKAGIPDFDLYTLKQDIPGHPKGSTVSERTLHEAGIPLPGITALAEKAETEPAEEKPTRITRKKALAIGHDVPEILGWSEEERRDFMQETIGVRSMKDVPKGKKGLDLFRTLTNALNQKLQEAGLAYEPPVLPTEELIATLEQIERPETGRPAEVLNRKNIQSLKETLTSKIYGVGVQFARLERWFEALDGRKEGAFYNNFWTSLNDASNTIDSTVNQDLGIFLSEIENQNIDAVLWMGKAEKIPGTNLQLTPTQRIKTFRMSQNEHGLKQLTDGMGYTQSEITAIINSMTDQEKQMAQWFNDKFEALWPLLKTVAIQSGIDPKTLKQEEFYSPIVRTDVDLEQQEDFLSDLAEPFRQEGFKPEKGVIQKRKPGAYGKIEMDEFVCYMHTIARANRFIAMAPIANKLGKILNNKDFKRALNDKTYGYGSKIINDYVKDCVRGHAASATSMLSRAISILRIRGITYAIGYNIASSLRQTLSLPVAIAVDPLMMKHVPINLARMATPSGFKAIQEFVYERAPELRHRNMDRDMRRRWNKIAIKRNLTFTKFSKRVTKMFGAGVKGDLETLYLYYKSGKPFSQSALSLVKMMDKGTCILVWKSFYDVKMERTKGDEVASTHFASKYTGRTQPMGEVQWLPAFFRGGVIEKLVSTFQNFVNNLGNFWYYDIYQAKKAGEIGWGMLSYRVFWSHIFPAVIFGMIGRGRLPKSWKDLGVDIATYPLGVLMIVGRLIDRMIRGWGNSGTIAETGLEAGVATGRAILRGNVKGIIKNAAKTIGALGGVPPTAQMVRTTEGAIDLMAGTTSDPRRLIYSEWALNQGKKSNKAPHRIRRRRVQRRR